MSFFEPCNSILEHLIPRNEMDSAIVNILTPTSNLRFPLLTEFKRFFVIEVLYCFAATLGSRLPLLSVWTVSGCID